MLTAWTLDFGNCGRKFLDAHFNADLASRLIRIASNLGYTNLTKYLAACVAHFGRQSDNA